MAEILQNMKIFIKIADNNLWILKVQNWAISCVSRMKFGFVVA
jgi:hypothetical protein